MVVVAVVVIALINVHAVRAAGTPHSARTFQPTTFTSAPSSSPVGRSWSPLLDVYVLHTTCRAPWNVDRRTVTKAERERRPTITHVPNDSRSGRILPFDRTRMILIYFFSFLFLFLSLPSFQAPFLLYLRDSISNEFNMKSVKKKKKRKRSSYGRTQRLERLISYRI